MFLGYHVVLCVFVNFLRSGQPAGGFTELLAVAGGKISLPCNVSMYSEENFISLVLWYKGDSGVPIYTFDVRRGPLSEARHFPSTDFGTRAYFDLSTFTTPSLSIEPVAARDEGDYKCRIDYRRSRTVNYNIRLKVIVPPQETIIMEENGKILREVIGPYDEGSFLTLICESRGGIPSPSVTWWRGSSLLDDTYFNTTDGAVRNELLLPRLQRYDLMATIICQASNTNLTSSAITSVIMDLNLKPLNVRITTSYRPVSYGRKLTLVCKSNGSRPPAHLSWWIERKKLSSGISAVSDDNNITTTTLTFQPHINDNGRYISCCAENPRLRNSAIEDRWTLNIYYKPILHLVIGAKLQPEAIREGSDVFFECNIKANPWISEIGWTFNGQPLFSNTSAGIILSNQSLVLQKVKRENRGNYRCIAANTEGEGISDRLSLQVLYAPVCKPLQNTEYGIARDETVNITCEVDADPPEVTFRWALNNTIETTEINGFLSNHTISTLAYTPRMMLGYGSLLCWARNRVGEQREPCTIKIIPAGAPEELKDCAVTNQTLESVQVECQPGYDGGLTQQFHLEVYTSIAEHLLANITAKDAPVFLIQGLPTATTFLLILYSNNAKGKSNSVTLTANTLSAAARRTANGDAISLIPVLGAFIGVIGFIVIIAIIVISILKFQGKDSDKGTLKKLETKEAMSLKHGTEDSQGMTKDPDVIPPKNDSKDILDEPMKRELESPDTLDFARNDYSQNSNYKINHKSRKKDELTYATLRLLRNDDCSQVDSDIHRTQYVELDFSNRTAIHVTRNENLLKGRNPYEKATLQVIQAPKMMMPYSNRDLTTDL